MPKPIPSRAEAVIIGGGIIGLSTAYHLAAKGLTDVLLLEKSMLGQGSTGKCAGGIRTQFSTEINIRFSLESVKVFERFEKDFGVDPEFRRVGYLFLATTPEQMAVLENNHGLATGYGIQVELLDPGEIRARWPFLETGDLLGGSFSPRDGFAGPYEVCQGLAKAARGLGVAIREETEVTGIQTSSGRISGVVLAGGREVATGLVVNAAGPFAGKVAALAGAELPVKPYRRQLLFSDPFDLLPTEFPLIIDLEQSWYIRREGAGLLLAGPQDEQSSFKETWDFEAMEWTAERGLKRVPVLEQARLVRGWAGLYEVSPDHHAIIGPQPEVGGLFNVNGFSGHGFQHGPAAGLVAAEMIVDGRATTIDVHPLRTERFAENDLIYEPLTAIKD